MALAEDQRLENPLLEGLQLSRRPEPCAMVIFGASGDLTRRKILPALRGLAADGRIRLLGAGRSQMSQDDFRKLVTETTANPELAARIVQGDCDVVLMGGGESMHARWRARREPRVRLDWPGYDDPPCRDLVGDDRPPSAPQKRHFLLPVLTNRGGIRPAQVDGVSAWAHRGQALDHAAEQRHGRQVGNSE